MATYPIKTKYVSSKYEAMNFTNYSRYGLIPFGTYGTSYSTSFSDYRGLMMLVSDSNPSSENLTTHTITAEGYEIQENIKGNKILTSENTNVILNSSLGKLMIKSETNSNNIKRGLSSTSYPYLVSLYIGINTVTSSINNHYQNIYNQIINAPYMSAANLSTFYNASNYYARTCLYCGMYATIYHPSAIQYPNAFSYTFKSYLNTPTPSNYCTSTGSGYKISSYVLGNGNIHSSYTSYFRPCLCGVISSPTHVDKSRLSIQLNRSGYTSGGITISSSEIKYIGQLTSSTNATTLNNLVYAQDLMDFYGVTQPHIYVYYKDLYSVTIPNFPLIFQGVTVT